MRKLPVLLLTISFLVLSGCGSRLNKSGTESSTPVADNAQKGIKASPPAAMERPAAQTARMSPAAGGGGGGGGHITADTYSSLVPLADVTAGQASTVAADRKIIRNGNLSLETDSPTDGLRKITSIAESLGGFVVTSEFKQTSSNQAAANQSVTVVARVPSMQFNAALEQIRSVGSRVIQENISGQDVSEEYLDLEARIRTQKALEAQFLEIMKQAHKVSDALEVQSQLAEVRTEIERLEGRRRFLENQSALSTITITLQMPAPLVVATTSGFGQSVKEALGDAIDIAASIVLGLLKLIIVLTPIAIIFGVPAWLGWRTLRRRLPKKAEPVAEPQG